MPDPANPYVSRGGLKLEAALDAFSVLPRGYICADLGCNMGGFTDCLLQRGAKIVYAVDTGYGMLAWKLRNDPRVKVLERKNALHLDPATLPGFVPCDLVVIDLAWTRQSHALKAALPWLRSDGPRQVITLIKPHYEADKSLLSKGKRGVLADDDAHVVAKQTIESLPSMGFEVLGRMVSPIRGGAGKGHAGNLEYLALVRPHAPAAKPVPVDGPIEQR